MIDCDGKFIEDKEATKTTRCLVHSSSMHNTADCRVYQEMAPEGKVQLLKEKRACWSCLKIGHRSIDCRQRKKCNSDDCSKYHHDADGKESGTCLLQVMKIKSAVNAAPLNVLWDGGATISLITFAKACELSLDGEEIRLSVVKVGGVKEEMRSSVYKLPLIDESGETVKFRVYGIDRISSPMEGINLNGVMHLFQNINKQEIQRTNGEIDVLIGYEYAGYHPEREQSSGHLLLLKNRFGRCLGGSHTSMAENTLKLIQHATVHHVVRINIENFFDTESLGVECSPRCGSCRCGRCPIDGKSFTLKEERELNLIEEGLTHEGDHWVVRYPWIRSPDDLPNNKEAALRMLGSTEKRLQKNKPLLETYKEQIQDMVQRSVARKLTQAEIENYDGPVYYLSHHEVLKPESTSTPCRIVFNLSAKFQGHSLNNCWAKGPDLMNNLLGKLVRFREGPVAFVSDIRKMYHAIKISVLDQHTHRFLWRDMSQDSGRSTYVMTSISFGDKPAGNIATVALRKTAEMQKDDLRNASDTILNNTYVDDIADSVETMVTARETTGQIDDLVKVGGFQIKHWIYSSENVNDDSANRSLGSKSVCEKQIQNTGTACSEGDEQKVLGVRWDSNRANFVSKCNLTLPQRLRNYEVDQISLKNKFQCLFRPY
ncbi:RNA-directed DNA polymerase from transposon BS [Paramuricea clavata]|uniref:RNA-directed DNA polymerase from transposon BS n=1 Tax=Paramuricea clavata TaxID=317549 RepID=A0A6S7JZ98_PARCT|nr:RNA-directed DNA polymerase from transposon BS [Paramuricea clavata]CAB4021211.1 RNA-directed DNA polymerase from transposon BS [Paramuricea clavata]